MHNLGEIAKYINADLIGDKSLSINSINTLSKATSLEISYINNKKHLNELVNTKASAVIVSKSLASNCPTNALIVDDPYLAFAKLSNLFITKNSIKNGIDPSLNINNVQISSGCVIGKDVILGDNCTIGANTVIGDNVTIGDNATIESNVVILHDCKIGNNIVISPGVIIGSEGFGNARDINGKWHSITHLGKVIIGDNVTIGANTTIDRGTIENTEIHDGVRLDNLVHIAHNVIIGEDSAIAASTGIAGSTKLGERCMIGGMVGIVGHLNICDDVIVNAKSTIDKDITKPGMYTGIMPLMPHKRWQNIGIWLTKLDKITKYLNIKLKNLKEK